MTSKIPDKITAQDTDDLGLTNETSWDIERDAAAAGWNACVDKLNAGVIVPPSCYCFVCTEEYQDKRIAAEGLTGEVMMITSRMFLCETCGNKRCPHAYDHRNLCTHSNEPGQVVTKA